MKTFEELGLSKEVLKVINELKFENPSEIQEKTIPLALAGKDIIAGSATGSGKTLAFASSIMENCEHKKGVQALVLTPTRELAEQVANSIKMFSRNKKLEVVAVYGGVDIQAQIRKLHSSEVVVGTPGRILDHLNRATVDFRKVKILVLDEVDKMFDMGFSRDVEKILSRCPKERQTMLFSATISSNIDYLAHKYTRNPVEVSVKSYVDHSKLEQIYYDVTPGEKFSILVHLLKEEKSDLVMVFCGTRRNADFVEINLNKAGIPAKAIHGGIVQNKRSRILEEFHEKGIRVLVCTDVAARGLDIKGVSHVYNYDLPKTSEEYVHRIGRTARAGETGKAVNILCDRDYDNFNKILLDKSLKIENRDLPNFKNIRVEFEKRPNRFEGRGNSGRNNSRGNNSGQRRNNRGSQRSNPFHGRRNKRF